MSNRTAKTIETEEGSFARRAAWLTAANTVAFGLSFLAPLLLVRLLDQTEFGIYKQVFQILATMLSVLNLQVASSAYYFMPRVTGKKLQVAMNVVAFYFAAGLAVALLLIIYPQCVLLVFQNTEVELVGYMPLLGVTILLWLVSSNLEVIPLALGDVRTSSVFIVGSQLTKSALTIGAALAFHTIRAIIWAAAIQGVLQILFMLGYLWRRFGSIRNPFDWPLFKAQVGNALPYGLGSFAQSTQGDLHNFVVSRYFPPADYAIYSIGLFQLPLLALLTSSFSSALLPEVSQYAAAGNQRGIIPVWLNAVRKLALVVVPACALMFVLRFEIITLLFTRRYESAVPIFTIYLFSALLPITLTGSAVRAHDEFKFFRLKLHLALLPLTWLGLYAGIRLAGLVGAVSAVVALQTLETAVAVFAVARHLGFTAKDLHYLPPVLKIFLAAALATLAGFAVKLLLPEVHAIATIAACATGFGLVYVASAFTLGLVTEAEKTEIRSTVLRFLSRGNRTRKLVVSG